MGVIVGLYKFYARHHKLPFYLKHNSEMGKGLCKSVHIWQSYDETSSVLFFDSWCNNSSALKMKFITSQPAMLVREMLSVIVVHNVQSVSRRERAPYRDQVTENRRYLFCECRTHKMWLWFVYLFLKSTTIAWGRLVVLNNLLLRMPSVVISPMKLWFLSA